MHRYAAANPVPELRARSAHAAPNFTDTREQERMVQALRGAGRLTDGPVELIETHISYVLLTGTHAYKIKKAVALPTQVTKPAIASNTPNSPGSGGASSAR